MLSRLSLSHQIDISPLFIELKELHKNEQNDYDCWLEKARLVPSILFKIPNKFILKFLLNKMDKIWGTSWESYRTLV